MLPTQKYLFVVSNSSLIKIYSNVPNQPYLITTIDLTQSNKELLSYDIYDIRYTAKEELLIVTQKA